MLCNHFTEKLLGLKGVIVKNVRRLPDRTEIVIELPKKPHVCPCCGHQTSFVYDYRWQTAKDIPAFGKHTARSFGSAGIAALPAESGSLKITNFCCDITA